MSLKRRQGDHLALFQEARTLSWGIVPALAQFFWSLPHATGLRPAAKDHVPEQWPPQPRTALKTKVVCATGAVSKSLVYAAKKKRLVVKMVMDVQQGGCTAKRLHCGVRVTQVHSAGGTCAGAFTSGSLVQHRDQG